LHHIREKLAEKPDVADKITDLQLSSALVRMVGKEIEVVEAGSGKRPSVYRRRMQAAS
jgi:hypothetical protein